MDPQPWHDAGLDAAYAFHRYINAKTVTEQAAWLIQLGTAMSDFESFLPGYDSNCTMPWERDEDIESHDDLYT